MKIVAERERLLSPLQAVSGVVERRQALPILSNLLLAVDTHGARVTATDMEVEIEAAIEEVQAERQGATTLPARKLLDICRALPERSTVAIEAQENKATVRCGRSRFVLSSLPAEEFPTMAGLDFRHTLRVAGSVLKDLIVSTQFAMAYQDIRYYLNGLLLEVSGGAVRAVATDGHRLALNEARFLTEVEEPLQVIVPRKGVSEFLRLLGDTDEEVSIQFGQTAVRLSLGSKRLTSKLIDGKFPDYGRVVPVNGDKVVVGDREAIRQGLARTSILSNEKFRGVRLVFSKNLLKTSAHNPEHEEAEEEIEVNYSGPELEIGFNAVYLLDVLGAIKSAQVRMEFTSPEKSCLIQPVGEEGSKYVVMPIRL